MPFPWSKSKAAEEGRAHYIRLRLRDINQLFNSMDPSPFIEKDLDDDAEEFIVSWAREFPSNDPIALRIYLDQEPLQSPGEDHPPGIQTPAGPGPHKPHHRPGVSFRLPCLE
jgi:hypothetical protein